MSAGGDRLSDLLRWYPPDWRARYGDELVALMEDTLGDGPPSPRFRASVAVAGLRQRVRGADLPGRRGSPADRVRDGSLLVLCSWTAFVVAGAAFAKQAEHFGSSLPPAQTGLPDGAFAAIQAAAALGAGLVVLGALAVLPAFVRFLRGGGWPSIRRRVLVAAGLTVLATASIVPMGAWAHSLTTAQRNGADVTYGVAFLTWAAAVAVILALWTAVAVRVGRRIELGRRVLGLEVLLAGGVALAMAVITGATAVWWGALSTGAPWFLHGTAPGTSPSPLEPRLVVTMAVMLAATAVAGGGLARAGRSWRRIRGA